MKRFRAVAALDYEYVYIYILFLGSFVFAVSPLPEAYLLYSTTTSSGTCRLMEGERESIIRTDIYDMK